ncbi:hypothetical protein AB0C29_28800 [Actinoplanes sp. NPDC048791]|uniref:hypothetical protein n=1 Tax=Actinoplanes sp. NPDC048791 TaxID=3154623 RepID=UPI00341068E1
MSWRCLSRPAVAGATLAAGVTFAAPASAAVTYNPVNRTGFVAAADVRQAFGWTPAKLAARAGGVAFDHDFWTDDTYSVVCGKRTYPLVHHREFGRYELTDAVVRKRATTGYGATGITGFRLAGASFGISGTSVAPAVGQPCPGRVKGATIDALRLVSSATGWSLAARSGDVRRQLLKGGKGASQPQTSRS